MEGRTFNPRLESLRGLAALAVLITHCLGTFAIDGQTRYWFAPLSQQTAPQQAMTIAGYFVHAGVAVMLFFVLSGYVLSLSLMRPSASLVRQIGRFFVRRAFRLLPAMWLSIPAIPLVRYLIGEHVPAVYQSSFYVPLYTGPIAGIGAMVENFVLIDISANPLTWTMYVEVIGSALLPLFWWLTSKSNVVGFALLFGLILLSRAHPNPHDAGRYLFCFQVGVVLACHPGLTRLCKHPSLFLGAAVGFVFIQEYVPFAEDYKETVMETAAGTSLILAVLAPNAKQAFRWLEFVPLRFFGQISYSVYLFHLAVLYVVAQLLAVLGVVELPGVLPDICLAVGTAILTTGVAWLSYRAVERPMIRIGELVTR